MSKLKSIALFMAALMVALPIYSATVFAGIVRVDASGGTDGIDGFIREEDWISFKVDLTITGDDDITPDQLLLLPAGTAFENCIGPNFDGTTSCTLRSPATGTWFFVSESPYTVRTYNDFGIDIGTRSDSITVEHRKLHSDIV